MVIAEAVGARFIVEAIGRKGLVVRLPRSAWLRIQHLALDEGTSFQALAVAALDDELKRRGLPGFDAN